MAHYLLSESAQQDIISIRDYTMETWGLHCDIPRLFEGPLLAADCR